jgi:PAS domain S-box-containing protein
MKAEELFKEPRRILVVDDNPRIHEDIRKIFSSTAPDGLAEDAEYLFGAQGGGGKSLDFELTIDSAHQGQEALAMVRQSLNEDRPYMMAFMDMRMPPGWDGLETIQEIWKICPALQIVICTAYSDRPWLEINTKLGASPNLLLLKKPFDNMEVLQMVQTLTCKWIVTKISEFRLDEMAVMVEERTYQMIQANEALKAETERHTVACTEWSQAEERFHAAFASSPSALAILDADSLEFKEANSSCLDLIGLPLPAVIGHTLSELDLAADSSGFGVVLNELRAGRLVEAMDIEIHSATGQKRHATLSIKPITISFRRYFLFALQETTEIRRVEAELRTIKEASCRGHLAGSFST